MPALVTRKCIDDRTGSSGVSAPPSRSTEDVVDAVAHDPAHGTVDLFEDALARPGPDVLDDSAPEFPAERRVKKGSPALRHRKRH